MIIGNGNIAKVLADRDDLVYFASGTSNSSCVDKLEFERDAFDAIFFDAIYNTRCNFFDNNYEIEICSDSTFLNVEYYNLRQTLNDRMIILLNSAVFENDELYSDKTVLVKEIDVTDSWTAYKNMQVFQ